MTDLSATDHNRNLASIFIARAEGMGLKGKRRDAAALDFFIGAGYGAKIAGNAQLAHLYFNVATHIIAVRGYFGVMELASVNEEKRP